VRNAWGEPGSREGVAYRVTVPAHGAALLVFEPAEVYFAVPLGKILLTLGVGV
jgi:hypothetical protein